MPSRLPIEDAVLARFCGEHGIRRLSLFGSRLHGTAGPESDVDLLVEFEPDARPTLLDMADMADELSVLLAAPVDLRTAADLSRYFREQVLEEAEVQFVAA